MKTVTLTILCDNTAAMKEGIRAEHGFSVLMETGKELILFDTGQSDVFWHNARVLGKDLMSLDTVVVSHGHYDHTGGLGRLARTGRPFRVLGHEDIFTPRYKKQKDGSLKYIGCPFTRDYLESRGVTFTFVSGYAEVAPDVVFVSEVPQVTGFETGDPLLVGKDREGRIVPDPFMDDASLYVRTPKGLIVILGCSHRGVVNILKRILTLEGDIPILSVIGGTHLARVGKRQVEGTIEALKALNIRTIGVSHCTGLDAAEILRQVFEERFFRAMAGVVVKINEKGGITIE